jgi:hypothetical protein
MDELAKLSKEKGTPAAAYLPFKTFLSAFDAFEHGVPNRIDRSIWRNQSGVVQGQILMALRFFKLIGENDEPRPALERFVTLKERRKEHVAALLQHSYKSILDHDLTKMTPKMLFDELENYGVSGETKRKASAFFLQAARFAELPMHPLLNTQTRAASTGPRKKRKVVGPSRAEVSEQRPQTPQDSSHGDTKSVRLNSGAEITIRISANWLELPSDERKFVFELIDLLQSPSAPVWKSDQGES